MSEAERVADLEAQVERLTRERDHAQAYADARVLGALQRLTRDVPVDIPILLRMEMVDGVPNGKPLLLNTDQIQGVFEAVKREFEKRKDWSILKQYERSVDESQARLQAESSNRDLWQEKAEASQAKMDTLANMVRGVSLMSVTPETCEQIQGVMRRMVEVVKDSDDFVVSRCACWYRARLEELKRQLHVAVEAASEEDREKVAAPFASPLRRLSDAVDSMDRANHATLLGIIPGGSTERVAQSVAPDGVDETPNGSLDSSAQPSAESDKDRGQGTSEKESDR